jgi:hypothetical protein
MGPKVMVRSLRVGIGRAASRIEADGRPVEGADAPPGGLIDGVNIDGLDLGQDEPDVQIEM